MARRDDFLLWAELLASSSPGSLQSSVTFGWSTSGALTAPASLSSSTTVAWTVTGSLTAPSVLVSSPVFGWTVAGVVSSPADPVSGTALFGWTLEVSASVSVRIFSASLGVSPAVSGSLALPVPQVGSLSVIVGDYQEALEIASALSGGLLVCPEVQSSL